jgi:hypothetical protein
LEIYVSCDKPGHSRFHYLPPFSAIHHHSSAFSTTHRHSALFLGASGRAAGNAQSLSAKAFSPKPVRSWAVLPRPGEGGRRRADRLKKIEKKLFGAVFLLRRGAPRFGAETRTKMGFGFFAFARSARIKEAGLGMLFGSSAFAARAAFAAFAALAAFAAMIFGKTRPSLLRAPSVKPGFRGFP